MPLIWTDIQDIAIELSEIYEDIDPRYINFVDLRKWVIDLPDFNDDPDRCGEKIQEAVQSAWIEEIE